MGLIKSGVVFNFHMYQEADEVKAGFTENGSTWVEIKSGVNSVVLWKNPDNAEETVHHSMLKMKALLDDLKTSLINKYDEKFRPEQVPE